MVGQASPMRQFVPAFENTEVKIKVFDAPRGPIDELYNKFLIKDLENQTFRKIVLEGLKNNNLFSNKLIKSDGKYTDHFYGAQIIDILYNDQELLKVPLNTPELEGKPYEVSNDSGRRDTLRMIISVLSIHLTNAMLAEAREGFIPICDDTYYSSLVTLRLSDSDYIGNFMNFAPFLGMEIVKSVIPDQILNNLNIERILEYRSNSKDTYRAWTAELGKLAVDLDKLTLQEVQREIGKIINQDVKPKIIEYENELITIRDKMFGDLLKNVSDWKAPTISLASTHFLSYLEALGIMASTLPAKIIPPITDYFQSKRSIKRKHSISYILGIK